MRVWRERLSLYRDVPQTEVMQVPGATSCPTSCHMTSIGGAGSGGGGEGGGVMVVVVVVTGGGETGLDEPS